MKRGVGLVCIHYAVEVPTGKAGEADGRMDRRLFRAELVGEPALDGHTTSSLPQHDDHPRRQAVHDQRRVVLPHAVSWAARTT